MCTAILIIQLAFIGQAHVKELVASPHTDALSTVDKLIDRARKGMPLHHSSMDNTALGKTCPDKSLNNIPCAKVKVPVAGPAFLVPHFLSPVFHSLFSHSSGSLPISGAHGAHHRGTAARRTEITSAALGRAEAAGAGESRLPPLSERTFFVTGSTDGIGKFTAEQLANTGCTLAIHGRNPKKVTQIVEKLKKTSRNDKIYGYVADLSLMSEVRRLAAEVSNQFPVIHGLLNNAGTFDGDYTGKRQVTAEGNEYSLAVNVMAPFLLTSLLLENVKASGAGRILITSSISAGASTALNDLQCAEKWDGHRAYSLSKLCDAMMTVELNDRYGNPPRLCFHTMDPGTVDTKMLRSGWGFGGASVQTATRSFKILTEDVYQKKSGELVSCSACGTKPQRVKLWADLEALTCAEYPTM